MVSEMVFRYVSIEFPNISNIRGDEDKTSESLDLFPLYAIFGPHNVGGFSVECSHYCNVLENCLLG